MLLIFFWTISYNSLQNSLTTYQMDKNHKANGSTSSLPNIVDIGQGNVSEEENKINKRTFL